MDKLIEQSLKALLAREGLEAKESDLERFAEIIELYMENLRQLHSVNLGAGAGVSTGVDREVGDKKDPSLRSG